MDDREGRIGWWISGSAHTALILWAILGGVFLRPQPSTPLRTTEVATISGAEFEALAAAARGAGPVGRDATAVATMPAPSDAEEAAEAPAAAVLPDAQDAAQELAQPDPSEARPDLTDFARRDPVAVATDLGAPAENQTAEEAAPTVPQPETLPDAAPAAQPEAPRSELALERSALPRLRPEGLVEQRNARLARQEAERQAAAEAARAAEQAEAAAAAEAEERRLTAEREAAEEARRAERAAAEEAERQQAAREAEAEAERQAAAERRQAADRREAAEREAREQREADAARAEEERRAAEAEREAAERRAAAEQREAEAAEAERRAAQAREAEAAERAAAEQAAREQAAAEQAAEERRQAAEAAERQAEEERRAAAEREAEERRAAAEREAAERAEADRQAEAARQQALEDALREAQDGAAGAEGTDTASTGDAAGGDRQMIDGGSGASAAQDPLAAALAGAMSGGGTDAPADTGTEPMQLAPSAIRPTPLDGIDMSSLSQAQPLSMAEKDAFRDALRQCWNEGALSVEARQMSVSVAFSMTADGRPIDASLRIADFRGGSEAAADHAFQVARRAIMMCGGAGFPLPFDKYSRWHDVVVEFRPDGIGFD
ncbi:protein TolA [uncultured Paracoccus sp.]|uniref:protein TolA n=1 Tax=uncultured Paracoccus sp. TaxID=189685 RepID=UPI0025F16050|nr:protein TolA [uncultured Paracoccus sp.]